MERELSTDGEPPELADAEVRWLGQLMAAGLTIGTAATAIEAAGVHGADRYGRFVHFGPGSPEAHAVLDMLAARFARQSDPEHGYEPSADDPELDRLDRFGWPDQNCPDFSALARKQRVVTPPLPRDEPASALVALGAVRAMMVRTDGFSGRVSFSSNAQLIEGIQDRFARVRGLGKRSLEELLPKADKALQARLKDVPPTGD